MAIPSPFATVAYDPMAADAAAQRYRRNALLIDDAEMDLDDRLAFRKESSALAAGGADRDAAVGRIIARNPQRGAGVLSAFATDDYRRAQLGEVQGRAGRWNALSQALGAPAAVASSGAAPLAATAVPMAGAPADLDPMDLAARVLHAEAAGQGAEGLAAAAHVMNTRARLTGGSLGDVVTARGQFEPWGNATTRARLLAMRPEDYAEARSVMDGVVAGRIPDPTDGATHFFAPDLQARLGRQRPSWAPEGRGLRIGGHEFHSRPGDFGRRADAGGVAARYPGAVDVAGDGGDLPSELVAVATGERGEEPLPNPSLPGGGGLNSLLTLPTAPLRPPMTEAEDRTRGMSPAALAQSRIASVPLAPSYPNATPPLPPGPVDAPALAAPATVPPVVETQTGVVLDTPPDTPASGQVIEVMPRAAPAARRVPAPPVRRNALLFDDLNGASLALARGEDVADTTVNRRLDAAMGTGRFTGPVPATDAVAVAPVAPARTMEGLPSRVAAPTSAPAYSPGVNALLAGLREGVVPGAAAASGFDNPGFLTADGSPPARAAAAPATPAAADPNEQRRASIARTLLRFPDGPERQIAYQALTGYQAEQGNSQSPPPTVPDDATLRGFAGAGAAGPGSAAGVEPTQGTTTAAGAPPTVAVATPPAAATGPNRTYPYPAGHLFAGLTADEASQAERMIRTQSGTPEAVERWIAEQREGNRRQDRQDRIDAERDRRAALADAQRTEAATRAATAAERAADRAGLGTGYQRNPDGSVSFIPDGPADPAVIRRNAAQQAQARGEGRGARPIPGSERTALLSASGRLSELDRLGGAFNNDFAGYVSGTLGDAANFVARNTPGDSPRATWWQDYQRLKNIVRNELFGAALTATEAREFEKADVNPGQSAETVRTNIARQSTIVRQALARRARSMAADGYNTRAIEEATGIQVEDAEDAGTERRVGGGSAPAGAAAVGRGGAPVRVTSPEEASRLAPGTEFTTPDGRRMRVPAR